MLKKAIGIYIDTKKIYLVILARILNRARLLVADSLQIPQDVRLELIDFGSEREERTEKKEAALEKKVHEKPTPAPLQEALRHLLKKHKIKEREVVATALSPDKVVIRYFQMPRLTPQEQKAAVPFESRKYLPYRLEDISYDYTISYDKVASNKMAVTFVAAEKASIAKINDLFSNTGVRLGYLEATPYSFMHLLFYTKEAVPNETLALVCVGENHATINLVRNDVLYLTRNVSFESKLGLAKVTASKEGLNTMKLEGLLSEISLSFDYFHRQFPEEKIGKLLLWSDEEIFKEGFKEISKHLNVDVIVRNPFMSIIQGEDTKVEYGVACGLGLRGLFRPDAGINLSPGIKKIEFEKLLRIAVSQICVVMAVLLLVHFVGMRGIKRWQRSLEEIKGQMPRIASHVEGLSLSALENTRSKYQMLYSDLDSQLKERLLITAKINRIAILMPTEIWLDRFTFGKTKKEPRLQLVLKGYIYTPREEERIKIVNQFLENLRKDTEFQAGFEKIKLDSISTQTYGDKAVASFQITCEAQ